MLTQSVITVWAGWLIVDVRRVLTKKEIDMSEPLRDGLIGRIESLAKANRRWRITGIAALAAVVALLVATAHSYSQRQPQGSSQPLAKAGPQFPVDASSITTTYANFCRVTGTPEELILDFGLNTQMAQQPVTEPVKVTNRVVMNFYTTKRLLGALNVAVQQHENTYGVIETEVEKRTRPGARQRPNE
jgi:hypothetical protein